MFSYSSHLTPASMPRRISLCSREHPRRSHPHPLASGLPVATAQAASTATCPSVTLSQPFLKWGDSGSYALVAGGDFESSPVRMDPFRGSPACAGSEPYAVTGKLGSWSLALPAGGSAQSPFTCVEPSDRTFRFFARSEGTEATVRASVVYETSLGNLAIPVGNVVLHSSWEPSPILHTGAALATAIANGTAHVALRFTCLSGSARLDDVFIDPRHR